jgi:hypothetical protein
MAVKFSTGVISRIFGKNGTDTGADGFRGVFTNGVIRFYSGAQPASADAATTGTLLGSVTIAGGAFVHGTATNGLNFGAPVLKVVSKAAAEDWKFKGIAAGTIGYFRFQGNATDDNLASTTLPRVDGSVGITSGDLRLSTVTAAVDSIITIDAFSVTGP